MPKVTLVVHSCGDRDGLYVDGTLQMEDSTLYACDVLEVLGQCGVETEVVMITVPDGISSLPTKLEDCLKWETG